MDSYSQKSLWAKRGLNPYRAAAIRKYVGNSLLDVGCGNGAYVYEFSNSKLVKGVDIHKYDEWSSSPNYFDVASADCLPYDDNSFDTVCCFEVLEHVKEPDMVLSELYRVCQKNIILSVPNCEMPPGMLASRLVYYHYTDPTHCNFFNQKTLSEKVSSSGFNVIENTLINPIDLFPILSDTFTIPDHVIKFMIRFLKKVDYRMTCLLVAEKEVLD